MVRISTIKIDGETSKSDSGTRNTFEESIQKILPTEEIPTIPDANFNNIVESLGDLSKNRKETSIDELILFFSFDIVNSSLYKTINYFGWSKVLNEVFKELQKRVAQSIEVSELWRVLGDEAIFIVRIQEKEEIFTYISKIYKILATIVESLKSGNFFGKLEDFSDREVELMKLQNIISLQASAWIAVVSNSAMIKKDDYNQEIDNIYEKYITNNKYEFFEFLGNDIDTGFRISKYTTDRRLVLSFELAYILAQKSEYLPRLNIITYKKLKGVWNEKLYPIIWYHEGDNSIESSFYFDECDNNDIIKEYFDNRLGKNTIIKDKKMFTDVYSALEKIVIDRKLKRKIDRMYEVIDKTTGKERQYINPAILQLHCVAVCCDLKNKRILIAKRGNRKINPYEWEFGCAKASLHLNLSDSIISEYKDDFGITVQPILNYDRHDKEPDPIAMYEVEKQNGLHKGVIVLAKIVEPFNVDTFVPSHKHQKLMWIEEKGIDTFSEKCVPDFKETLRFVFDKIKGMSDD